VALANAPSPPTPLIEVTSTVAFVESLPAAVITIDPALTEAPSATDAATLPLVVAVVSKPPNDASPPPPPVISASARCVEWLSTVTTPLGAESEPVMPAATEPWSSAVS
jgi:hypothetical protein